MEEEDNWEGEEDLAKELHQFKDMVRAELATLSETLAEKLNSAL